MKKITTTAEVTKDQSKTFEKLLRHFQQVEKLLRKATETNDDNVSSIQSLLKNSKKKDFDIEAKENQNLMRNILLDAPSTDESVFLADKLGDKMEFTVNKLRDWHLTFNRK